MKDKSVLSVAFLLISAAVIGTYDYFVYGLSAGGTAHLLGQVLGGAAIVAIILFVSRMKVSYLFRVAVSILIGTAVMGFHNYDELTLAIDTRFAIRAMGGAQTDDDFMKLVSANPTNKALQAFGIVWSNGAATRKKIAELSAEPPELDKITGSIGASPLADMPEIIQGLRKAQKNAGDVGNAISALYDDELASSRDALKAYGDNDFAKGLINGVATRHDREKPFMVRSLKANESLYAAMAAQAEFIIERQGHFDQSTGRMMFQDSASVEQWNALSATLQAVLADLQAVEVERTQLQQIQTDNVESLKKL